MQENAHNEIDRHMRLELTRMRQAMLDNTEYRERSAQVAELARLRLELAAVLERARRCRCRLDHIKQSLSWRITRPARRIRKWLARRFPWYRLGR